MKGRRFLSNFTAIILIYIALPVDSHAVQPGGQAGGFLRLGLGADRLAMGDCGAALVGGSMNWYYNPAGIPGQRMRQASIGYRLMSLDRSIMYAGFSTPLKPKAGLAFGVMRAGTDNIDMRDSNGNRFDMLSQSENLFHGSFGLQPHPIVALGISIKWLISAVPDILEDEKNLYAYGMSMDLGLRLVASPKLKFGLQIRDLGGKYSWETSELWGDERGSTDDDLPTLIRAGAAWNPIRDLTLVMDLVVDPDRAGDDADAVEPRFGAELMRRISDKNRLALRAGYNGKVITSGFGIDFDLGFTRAEMNYAFYVEDIAPDAAHLIGWVFRF